MAMKFNHAKCIIPSVLISIGLISIIFSLFWLKNGNFQEKSAAGGQTNILKT
jgi:hypothetical protein